MRNRSEVPQIDFGATEIKQRDLKHKDYSFLDKIENGAPNSGASSHIGGRSGNEKYLSKTSVQSREVEECSVLSSSTKFKHQVATAAVNHRAQHPVQIKSAKILKNRVNA